MIKQRPPAIPFFLFFCWLTVSGCGTEEAGTGTGRPPNPEAPPSCETLASLVLQAPLTGATFHCLWCNRKWTWRAAADDRDLFVLVAFSCERLRGDARLELRDSGHSVLWEKGIRQGEHETFCTRLEGVSGGLLSLTLRGDGEPPLLGDLIEEFQGSVYMKIINEHGEPAGALLP